MRGVHGQTCAKENKIERLFGEVPEVYRSGNRLNGHEVRSAFVLDWGVLRRAAVSLG